MKRNIIKIDEEKCTGCGLCIPNCPEGAIQIIDNKARLVSDLMCDGLGACLGYCPEGAINIEEREAEEYDERKVMVNIVKAGENTIIAHLKHLRDHNQTDYYNQAMEYLNEKHIPVPILKKETIQICQECPGSQMSSFDKDDEMKTTSQGKRPSQLTHWPIQMHLISPHAPHYQNSDLLLAADCTAFSLGGFHKDYLKGKTLAIACPKLDKGLDVYLEKLKALIDDAKINSLTVLIMQVPCCGGLLHIAREAASQASRKISIKKIVIGVEGEILSENWI